MTQVDALRSGAPFDPPDEILRATSDFVLSGAATPRCDRSQRGVMLYLSRTDFAPSTMGICIRVIAASVGPSYAGIYVYRHSLETDLVTMPCAS